MYHLYEVDYGFWYGCGCVAGYAGWCAVLNFYEANRQLIKEYREAHRVLVAQLNGWYREEHEKLVEEFGREVGDLWV